MVAAAEPIINLLAKTRANKAGNVHLRRRHRRWQLGRWFAAVAAAVTAAVTVVAMAVAAVVTAVEERICRLRLADTPTSMDGGVMLLATANRQATCQLNDGSCSLLATATVSATRMHAPASSGPRRMLL